MPSVLLRIGTYSSQRSSTETPKRRMGIRIGVQISDSKSGGLGSTVAFISASKPVTFTHGVIRCHYQLCTSKLHTKESSTSCCNIHHTDVLPATFKVHFCDTFEHSEG